MTIKAKKDEGALASRRGWSRQIGACAFAFFFIKGMAWLALPIALWLFD